MPGLTPLRSYPYPLYNEPADFPTQIGAFANAVDADVDALALAQQQALESPSARIISSALQNLAPSVGTALTFTTESYDNAAMVNLGVNNDRIFFQSLGVYLIHAECTWESNGNATLGGRRLYLNFSVGGNMAFDGRRGAQSQIVESTITYLHKATVIGSYVRASAVHTSGAAVDVGVRSFSVTRVSN